MPILYDTHMHSSFSTDSDAPMDHMVRRAMSLGLRGVCFTEHLDLDYPPQYYPDDPGAFQADPAVILAKTEELKAACAKSVESISAADGSMDGTYGNFFIGFGMEFGMQSHLAERYESVAAEWPFDFIIASQHLAGGRDLYYPEEWEGRSFEDVITAYYEEMLSNIQKMTDWDTLGHLDYIIRYIPGWKSSADNNMVSNQKREPDSVPFQSAAPYDSWDHHPELIDAILSHVIKSGKCLEVNTAGYKYGLGQPNPAPSILRRYRELGGSMITIGADAHEPDHIAFAFGQARELLLSLGFHSYNVYRQRVPKQFSL